MKVILLPNHVYYTSHLDRDSCALLALCGMIVMLFGSSVSFLKLILLMEYLCLFLQHGSTNEYIYFTFNFLCGRHLRK